MVNQPGQGAGTQSKSGGGSILGVAVGGAVGGLLLLLLVLLLLARRGRRKHGTTTVAPVNAPYALAKAEGDDSRPYELAESTSDGVYLEPVAGERAYMEPRAGASEDDAHLYADVGPGGAGRKAGLGHTKAPVAGRAVVYDQVAAVTGKAAYALAGASAGRAAHSYDIPGATGESNSDYAMATPAREPDYDVGRANESAYDVGRANESAYDVGRANEPTYDVGRGAGGGAPAYDVGRGADGAAPAYDLGRTARADEPAYHMVNPGAAGDYDNLFGFTEEDATYATATAAAAAAAGSHTVTYDVGRESGGGAEAPVYDVARGPSDTAA